MAKLRDTDLLSEEPARQAGEPQTRAAEPIRSRVDDQLADLAARSPLLLDPLVLRVQREERVMIAFNHMPRTYKERFDAAAKQRGMGLKEMFVDMMRVYGIEVPPYSQIDGRRRG